MRINTNVSSLMSYNSLAQSTGKLEKTIARLSTGLKINTAADDAAGLAISEKMNAQARGLDQAYRNVQDGISLLQTADGALGEIHAIAQRMRELSVQAANGTLTADDRSYIQLEIDQLTAQINDIATQTQFNKKKLLDGSSAVLWSTSSRDIGVIVTGSLLGRDQFGQVTNAEGNYKITFSSTVVGQENIQKSNVLSLKHGTSQTNVQIATDENGKSISGLTNLQALNMVEGSWHLETRERPFGGVRYYNGGTAATNDPDDLGVVKLEATGTPHIVAPGEYDVRLSDKVPMMATFVTANDRVAGVNISSSHLSRDFDATLAVAQAAGTGAMETLHDAHAGTAMSVTTNAATQANAATFYEVTQTDRRDVAKGNTIVQQSYKTADDADIGINLTYKTQASEAEVTYTYKTVASSSINYNSTWRTSTATALEYEITFANGMTEERSIDIGAGVDLEGIETAVTLAVNNLMPGGLEGLSITHSNVDGNSSLELKLLPTPGNANVKSIKFQGDLAEELKLKNVVVTNGQTSTTITTGKDWNVKGSISVDAGKTIDDVVDAINDKLSGASKRDATASVIGGPAAAKIKITQDGTSTVGNNNIVFSNASGSFAELGLSTASVGQADGSAFTSGTSVYNGHTATININAGQDMTALAASLGASLAAAGVGAATSVNSNLTSLHLTNTSMYDVKLVGKAAGDTINELTNGAGLTSSRGQNSGNTAGVFNNVTLNVNNYSGPQKVGDKRMDDLLNPLNTAIDAMLKADGIDSNNSKPTNAAGGTVNYFTVGGTNAAHQISFTNYAKSGYDIQLVEVTAAAGHKPLEEMWSGNKTASRGGTAINSDGMAFQLDTTIANTGAEMKDIFDGINGIANLKAEWIEDPTVEGNHWGQMRITNETHAGSGAARRVFNIRSENGDDGETRLNSQRAIITHTDLDTGKGTATEGRSANSNTWQTSDAVQIRLSYEGNWATGERIGALPLNTVTIGQGDAASHGNRNTVRDWIWEGTDTPTINQNTALLNQNAAALSRGGVDYFNSFQITDANNQTNAVIGDTMMRFTTANTAANQGSTVTVNMYDSALNNGGTGVQSQLVYAFNADVLSAGGGPNINQMLYKDNATGPKSVDTITHYIDFGSGADGDAHTIQYGERKDAIDGGYANIEDWNMGQVVDAWYSHAYYGKDTTYYFQQADVDTVLHDEAIAVDRQNGINATIMFEVKGGDLSYMIKGVKDDGSNWGDNDNPFKGTATVKADGTLEIGDGTADGTIKFSKFSVNASSLMDGDKFVVNVAAAAKMDSVNTTGAADQFTSYANIQIEGDPFQQGNEATGSSAQYRMQNGTEDGKPAMNLLGFFVSPVNGGNDERGVGYYDGTLSLSVAVAGFAKDSTVGKTSHTTATPGAKVINTQVNYQGNTKFSAGALVTSAHFQKKEYDPSLVIANYVQGISYSDYKFGIRADGTYGWLNDKAKDGEKYTYSDMNGSLIFEAIAVEPNVITFRVQGHFIDRNGKEYYAEEEAFTLNAGRNTDKDSSDATANNTDPNQAVHMFRDSEFGGIFFDELKLGNIENWMAGDRFTVALTASGFQNGTDEESQLDPTDAAHYSTVDEIGIFSDNRGATMPASFRFNEGILDNNTVDLKMYQIVNNLVKEDSNNFYIDQVLDGTLTLSFGEPYNGGTDPDKTVPHAATFDIVYGRGNDYGVAHYYSNVEDIAQFYDKNGRFLLDGSAEGLTIRQGDRETTVQLSAGTEVGELTKDLSAAIWDDLLKQYIHGPWGENDPLDQEREKPYMLDEADKNKIIQFVNTVPGKSPNEAVAGTMLAHSVLAGEQSALEFYGSEDVMKALAFTTIQSGRDNEFSASVTDAHTGNALSTNTKVVAGTTSYDVMMDGIALRLDTDLGIRRATFSEAMGTFKLEMRDTISEVIHLADNTTTLQIGANEGEDMFLTLGDMSASALGIENLSVRSQASAARSITRIDGAISAISKQRALIGAQINRLEHTMVSLAKTSTNLKESRSRIVDANIASEMLNHARLSIVTQAGTSMLAQANQLGSNVMALLR